MRVLTGTEVQQLLPMSECIPLMESALVSLSRGEVELPLRTVMRLSGTPNVFAMMPVRSRALPELGAKVITVFPGNQARGLDAHQGAVLLFDAEDGRLAAVVDASSITAIRTAAVSAVATRLLARPRASTLALLGSGVQARAHLSATLLVRPITRLRVWSRDASHAEALADRARRDHHVHATVLASAREAVRGADVVCTVTASREPVLRGAWLEPGMHVNAVGASQPDARELDAEAVARARLYADRRESLHNESAAFRAALAQGLVDEGHVVAELGEVALGTAPGRGSSDEITLFKSLGLAIEDLAAASHALRRAERDGVGAEIAMNGHQPDEGPA